MISAEILQRTYRIKYGKTEGTCFAVDYDRHQYVVTAAHILGGIAAEDRVLIFHEKTWKGLTVRTVGTADPAADVAVLAASVQLAPAHRIAADSRGVQLSQDVYFLGFPYGLYLTVGDINHDFPLALIKKGIVSSLEFDRAGVRALLIDGHNNPGFSGGPVVFYPNGKKNLRVAGVVSGYKVEWGNVFQQGQVVPLTVQQNTGIVVAYSIQYALNLIEANPVGFPLD